MSSVAVKNPETSSPSVLDRLHVGILAGVVYLLGSLAILFALLPWLWWDVFRLDRASVVNSVLLVLVGCAAAGALGFVGLRLLGPQPTPGIKAGIFVTLVLLLLIVLLTRWASIYFEAWVYESHILPSATVGIALTAAVGVVLLILAARLIFMAPSFGPKMVGFEEQGWFSTSSFKRSQGQRVRRGTILGILTLVGCGIYALIAHQTLAGTKHWGINIPFTGRETVTTLNDAAVILRSEDRPLPEVPYTEDLGSFREMNEKLKARYVKLEEDVRFEKGEQPVSYSKGQVITNEQYDEARKALLAAKQREPSQKAPEPATGTVSYATLTLLPDVRYTLPLLLSALAIWVAWRVVNVPTFADFLIATEAEVNKVSWTTRRRLIQDTIVVLVTVLLFTVFLFVVDVAWAKILSWKPIGVLKLPEGGAKADDRLQQNW
jgi:preprotein translocase SecE subunit